MRRRVIAAWALFTCTAGLAIVWVVGVASGSQDGEVQFLLPTLAGSFLGLLLIRRQPENRIRLVSLLASFGGVVADASSVVQSRAAEHELDGRARSVRPPAVGVVAITRYRLYETDRIVSRTATSILVLATLAAAYAAVFYVFTEALPFEDDLAVGVRQR